MKPLLSLTALLISATAPPPAYAQQVMPKLGFCPSGYRGSGDYCVPGSNAKEAFVKTGSFCPSGYYGSGKYCVSTR